MKDRIEGLKKQAEERATRKESEAEKKMRAGQNERKEGRKKVIKHVKLKSGL